MRAVVQRVASASVKIRGELISEIGPGLLVLVAAGMGDEGMDADFLADKTVHLRIFEDEQGKMNLDLLQKAGEVLVVSQFTLFGDSRKGRRPSFVQALDPVEAEALVERFTRALRKFGAPVQTGRFREMMDVAMINQGPVTMLLDSKRLF